MDTTTAAIGPSPVLLVLPLVVFLALNYATSLPSIPKNMPWIGKSDGFLSETRASWASFSNARKWFAEGYKKVSSISHRTTRMLVSQHFLKVLKARKMPYLPRLLRKVSVNDVCDFSCFSLALKLTLMSDLMRSCDGCSRSLITWSVHKKRTLTFSLGHTTSCILLS